MLWSAVRDQALLALPDSLRALFLGSSRVRKLDWVASVPALRVLELPTVAGSI
jgi:hypothetical protein